MQQSHLKTAPWGENMNLRASRAGAGSMALGSRGAAAATGPPSSGRKLMLPPSSAYTQLGTSNHPMSLLFCGLKLWWWMVQFRPAPSKGHL